MIFETNRYGASTGPEVTSHALFAAYALWSSRTVPAPMTTGSFEYRSASRGITSIAFGQISPGR